MFLTSEELIKKVNADSPTDTEDFLNAYYPYFKILLKHYGCRHQDVDDLCTPIALKLLKALKTFDRKRPGSLRKLINLITKRTLINHFKKLNSKKQQPNQLTSELIPELHEKDSKVNWQVKDCDTIQKVCNEAIESYLNRIEPLTYKALKMYVMEYKNAQEVSDTLEMPANSVYNHKRNFFLKIVEDATELYKEKTSEEIEKTVIAEALYNYLLDNNPALTIVEAPVPDKLIRQVSFLRGRINEFEIENDNIPHLIFTESNLEPASLTKDLNLGSRKADIIIEDQRISGPHCEFKIDSEGHVSIKDLVSENGTYVNGQKIDEQLLIHGDLIQLGNAASIIFYHQEIN
ncbi:MAG: FHA domain-containing protein [Lentisphaeraceae bacterium]|nr:FHA domain-containing protein [Lentisphaeraceae bacterium]